MTPLEVTFRGHQNQLQRLPLHCPWSAICKKVYHVGVNMCYCYNTNLPPLPEKQSNIPTCITNLTSLIPFIIPAFLHHHFTITYLNNMLTRPVTPIYHPYLNTNQTSLSTFAILHLPSLLASSFPIYIPTIYHS